MPESASMIKITVNGEAHNLPAMCSLQDLSDRMGIDIKQVAIEHNQQIVPKSMLSQTVIKAGDHIEIVEFIGGG